MGADGPWEQLARGIDLPFHPDLVIPELYPVTLDLPTPAAVIDPGAAARSAIVERLAGDVTPGMTVAVGADCDAPKPPAEEGFAWRVLTALTTFADSSVEDGRLVLTLSRSAGRHP